MARINDEEIEKLKKEVELKMLVESFGVKLENKGKDLIGLCPFHDDREPSLVITPDKNLWHCLGACQEGGSTIDWVMKTERVSFRHAVEILREKGGYIKDQNLKNDFKPIKRSTTRKLENPFDLAAKDQKLLNQVVEFYHETLKQSPEGLSYLESRNLKNAEMIDHFKLGLSNRTLCYRLPEKSRKHGEEIRTRLNKLGILRSSGHEHFNGSLIIPIFDENKNVVEIYGRKIRNDLRKGTPFHLYLPGPHKGVWNIEALKASGTIILCESLIDALSFWCYGFRNVTSSYGTNGFRNDHLNAFLTHKIEQVFIAYDRDKSGNKAAEKVSQKLMDEGIECFRIKFPMDMDANDFACKMKPVDKAFSLLIQNAEWMGKGKKTTIVLSELKEKAAKEENLSTLAAEPSDQSENKIPTQVKKEEITITLGERRWRVRGLSKNMSYDLLKVNLLVSKEENFHVDSIDLYCARHRSTYIKQAADELSINEDIIKTDLGKVLLKLEELQDEQIKKSLEPKKKEIILSENEKQEAFKFLKEPDLLSHILNDFETCGVVGEHTNKLVGYLASVSRKLELPLAVLIQSSSAAGKTWLMESILNFVPEEERVKYSAMTGQSLFYMGKTDIKHKILAIMEEEGAECARYALKLLQSEGELSIASTGKDPSTGKLITNEYRVEGPVMIFSTTTNIDIDEELLNRCIVLTVNESREQTRAIHQLQRERRTLKGLKTKREKLKILKLHRNGQRLLRSLPVVNPYAPSLTFLDDRTRTRRDHDKYLNLIDSIALLHQYQRPIQTMMNDQKPVQYISVTLQDIEIANELANEVLGRSLDELPPQTRRFLNMLYQMVDKQCKQLKIDHEDYRFSRRQVCKYTSWSLTQVRVHLYRLVEHEYVVIHRGGRGQSFVYELIYNGEGIQGEPFLPGLIDVEKLRHNTKNYNYDKKVAVKNGELAGPKRGQNAPKTGGWRSDDIPLTISDSTRFSENIEKNAYINLKEKNGHKHIPLAAKVKEGIS